MRKSFDTIVYRAVNNIRILAVISLKFLLYELELFLCMDINVTQNTNKRISPKMDKIINPELEPTM